GSHELCCSELIAEITGLPVVGITIAPPRESSQFKGSVAWKCAQHPGSRRPRTPAGRRVLRAWACLDQGLNFSSEDEEKVYGTLPVQNGKRMPGCRSLPKDPLARHISRWATTMGESPALQESTLQQSHVGALSTQQLLLSPASGSTSPSSPPGIIPSERGTIVKESPEGDSFVVNACLARKGIDDWLVKQKYYCTSSRLEPRDCHHKNNCGLTAR
ncbi:hypothetical protein NQZ68_033078, partial [Dissostichus eleginoides]